MVRLRETLKRLFLPLQGVAPGLYPYRRQQGERELRLHLRVEADGAGLLAVNASGVLHLNATATLLMKHVLDGASEDEAVTVVQRVYKAAPEEVRRDFEKIQNLVRELETEEDACPILRLDVADIPPFGKELSAPYRADLALTYRCNNNCQHCYVARRATDVEELPLEDWKAVLQRLWDAGVPHVCFTGGEATLSPHLRDLIEHAEDIGLITGLLTNGRKLADAAFTRSLCEAGLDHVQITIESHDPAIHDSMIGHAGAWEETVAGIRTALAEDLYLVTNTTLCTENVDTAEETIAFVADLGVEQFAMNSIIHTGRAPAAGVALEEEALADVLGIVQAKAAERGLRFIWYSPTHYCRMNPTEQGVGFKRCTAGEYNICIEPDGQVIPCQSYYQPVGHILRDSWETIWQSDLFRALRTRADAPDECQACPDFEVCGSGCPLSDGERFLCTDSPSEG